MGRDVEVDVTANDQTGPGLASAERKFRQTNDKIQREQEKAQKALGPGLLSGVLSSSPKISAAISSALSQGASVGIPALVAAVAGAGPFLGAAIGGAITAGIGVGVAGIGIALAAQDTRVKQAATDLWKGFTDRATQAAGQFVRPVLDGLKQIDAALDRVDIKSIFKDAAQFVAPLTDTVTSLIEDLSSGIGKLTANAGPAVEALATGISEIGRSLGEGLESLADNGESSADALSKLLLIVDQSVDSVFRLVNVLTEVYEIGQKFRADFVLETILALGELAGKSNEAADGQRRLGEGTFGASEQIKKAAEDPIPTYEEAVKAANDAAREFTSTQQSIYSATTNVATALANASETIKDNGKTLSLNSEKGRENRDALSGVASAMTRQYEATVKANGVGVESYGVATKNTEAFVGLARKAGLSAGAARNLAEQLGLIPTKRETKIAADTRAAEARLAEIQSRLNNINSKTVTVTVKYRGDGSNQNSPSIGGGGGRTFDANTYWATTNDGGTRRTGGPAQVSVENNVAVTLDGRPFYEMTAEATRASERRMAWKQRVGGRA